VVNKADHAGALTALLIDRVHLADGLTTAEDPATAEGPVTSTEDALATVDGPVTSTQDALATADGPVTSTQDALATDPATGEIALITAAIAAREVPEAYEELKVREARPDGEALVMMEVIEAMTEDIREVHADGMAVVGITVTAHGVHQDGMAQDIIQATVQISVLVGVLVGFRCRLSTSFRSQFHSQMAVGVTLPTAQTSTVVQMFITVLKLSTMQAVMT
jgi:hypothetical protein